MPMVPASFSDLAEKVRSGVVNIQVIKKVQKISFKGLPAFPSGDRSPFEVFSGP